MDRKLALKMTKSQGTTINKLGLRFDRVVLRLSKNLSDFSKVCNLNETIVLITLQAPIKWPAKTEKKLVDKIRKYSLTKENKNFILCQNSIRLKHFAKPKKNGPSLLFLVHRRSVKSQEIEKTVALWIKSLSS